MAPLPAVITPFTANAFSKECTFVLFSSFLIISQSPFISNSDLSKDLTIFIISCISSFQFINAVVADP